LRNTAYILLLSILFLSHFFAHSQEIDKALTISSFSYVRDIDPIITKSTVDSKEFEPVNEKDLNWGSENGWYWFKISVNVSSGNEGLYHFKIPSIHVKSFSLFMANYNNIIHLGTSGNDIPIHKKPELERLTSVPTYMREGINTFYIQTFFWHEAYFPLTIINDNTYLRSNINSVGFSGAYFGFASLVIILNIFMFFTFKERVYIYYVLFLFVTSASIFYDDGFFSYFFPDLITHYDFIEMLLHWLCGLMATLFSFTFLRIGTILPRIKIWFYLALIISAGLYISSLIFENFYLFSIAGYVLSSLLIGCWVLCWYVATKYTYAYIIVVAYLILLFSSIAHFALPVTGFQFINITSNEVKLGGITEMLVLSAALLYRFKYLKKENHDIRKKLEHYVKELQATADTKERTLQESVAQLSTTHNLSKRETEVLLELSKGYTNKQIGEELHISIATVKFHTSNIYAKLDVSNRSEVIEKIS
jgi:DNA-binding CsgD family transcriptional regulator